MQIAQHRDQGVRVQQPERHARHPHAGRLGQGAPHPRHDHHRDAVARPTATFQAWQSTQLEHLEQALAQATGEVSAPRRRRPHERASRSAGRARLERRRPAGRRRRVRRGARAQRRRQVHAGQGHPRPGARWRAATCACWARRPGGPTTTSATCRSAAASTPTCASAASTSCASASTATGGASRCPAGAPPRARADADRVAEVIELVGAADYAGRPIGEVSGGEQQRLLIAQALVQRPGAPAARRAARQPRPPQPGGHGRAARRDLRDRAWR